MAFVETPLAIPKGAFLFHNLLASSSEARSYEVNVIFLTWRVRNKYSVVSVVSMECGDVTDTDR